MSMLQQTSVFFTCFLSSYALFNFCLKFSFEVIHELVKGYPKFQTKAHKTYPELNGGQIRRARGLSVPNRYMNYPLPKNWRIFAFIITEYGIETAWKEKLSKRSNFAVLISWEDLCIIGTDTLLPLDKVNVWSKS